MITFLRNNFDPDYQLPLSGALLTIKENDPMAKLTEVRVALPDHENSFAFFTDRKKEQCDNRNCPQSKRSKCNKFHSKACNFLQLNKGLHKGCDVIIVTCEDKNVFFTVCDLKSEKSEDYGQKFEMARALISYLCELVAKQGYHFFLQFVLFKTEQNASRHSPVAYARKEPGRIEIKTYAADNLKYSRLSFTAFEAATKPQVTLKRIQEGDTGEENGSFYTCTCSLSCPKSKP